MIDDFNYKKMRDKIISLSSKNFFNIKSIKLDNCKGIDNEDLFVDTIYIGNENAENLLVIISGTHGVEGYCGSICQLQIIEKNIYDCLTRKSAILIIHALNPYGFSWSSRTDQNNIDVNRNFIDFDKLDLENDTSSCIHDMIFGSEGERIEFEKIKMNIETYIMKHGQSNFINSIYSGQSKNSDGIFYSGQNPSWSYQTIKDIYSHYGKHRKLIFVYDIHTGLGSYGCCSPVYSSSSEMSLYSAKNVFGDELILWNKKNENFPKFSGKMIAGLSQIYKDFNITNITLEFGTYDKEKILQAVVLDNIVRRHRKHKKISDEKCLLPIIKNYFFPEDPEWMNTVLSKFEIVMYNTLAFIDNF